MPGMLKSEHTEVIATLKARKEMNGQYLYKNFHTVWTRVIKPKKSILGLSLHSVCTDAAASMLYLDAMQKPY